MLCVCVCVVQHRSQEASERTLRGLRQLDTTVSPLSETSKGFWPAAMPSRRVRSAGRVDGFKSWSWSSGKWSAAGGVHRTRVSSSRPRRLSCRAAMAL